MLLQVKKFANLPLVHLITAVIVLVATGNEVLTNVEDGLRSEHGLMVYAILHIIRTFPDVVFGLVELAEARND